MPKLSKHTLEKMYSCPHCGKKFRQLNGLSGHIQWAHAGAFQSAKKDVKKEFLIEPDQVTKAFLQHKHDSLIGQAVIDDGVEKANIKADWFLISDFLKEQKMVPNESDYKTYLICALAVSYGNQRLMKTLSAGLSTAIRKLQEIAVEMTSKSASANNKPVN